MAVTAQGSAAIWAADAVVGLEDADAAVSRSLVGAEPFAVAAMMMNSAMIAISADQTGCRRGHDRRLG
jgi:hypothetical protein